jgi:hypothetical protein
MPRIIKPAKGTFTTADITVDSSGRIITASSGSAGGSGAVIPQFDETGPASGTYTAQPGTGSAMALLAAGGGGGGEAMPANVGGVGGKGGFGLYEFSVSQPYSQPYSIGGGGSGGDYDGGPPKTAGGSTNLTNVGTVNGGAAGGGAGPANPGNTGTAGTAPGKSNQISITTFQGKNEPSGGNGGSTPRNGGGTGSNGFIVVYEDS